MDKRVQDLMESANNKRAFLAEDRWKDYCEGITNPYEARQFAQVCENQANHLANLDEETRTSSIGSFEKFIFPMMRAVWPTLVSTELVSVQAMEGPTSTLFYLDFVAGSTKGAITKGDTLISARTGMREQSQAYQSETIDIEGMAAGGGTLSYLPIRPGSMTVNFTHSVEGALVLVDDGNGSGAVTSNAVTVTLTVNYVSGVYSFGIAGGGSLSAVSGSYTYNSEGPDFANNPIPQLDAVLTSGPVISRPDKLRTRWSLEVSAQLKAVQGLDAEFELMTALGEQIRFGIDNKIINNLYKLGTTSGAGQVTFDYTPPTGVPQFTHQMALLKTIYSGSNAIFKATRRGFGNWIVCGVDAATIFESHPLFESSGNPQGPGVVFAGTFAGRWKVYKNPFLTNQAGSGFNSSNFLIGYKGNSWYDAGYIYAPWIPFFATPTVILDDMMFRRAALTHYGVKAVNGLFYATGLIDHA